MSINKKIVIFESEVKEINLEVPTDKDTVWLNRSQLSSLFDRDVKTIGKHVKNALEEELDSSTVAKFATVQTEGHRNVKRQVEYYNLDVIISVGYRVKSKRGVEFRRWANKVLKQYIIQGYSINDHRIKELGNVVKILKRSQNKLDSSQVIGVIEQYTKALSILDDYDHQCMSKPKGNDAIYVLDYDECRKVIYVLAALTILIAESNPSEKETIVS